MGPTSPAALAAWAVAGLALGWLWRPVSGRLFDTPTVVTWAQPTALAMVAAILAAAAWATWRSVHVHRVRLEPHQAVNRLVLARACAYVGALTAGGYLGYALSWVGVDTELADQRLWRSLFAAGAAAAVVAAGVLLERACRVRTDDEEP
ncbi:DUF3180 domain-containing protein [Nocardioides sp. SYSU D00038]|uniref:DUF3180 domain-containing protein n=1 Tax=Nocardioides sp. SYSU D00038 TaxID=2812554 RepID=UPI0019687FAD|nr:DUF3180 domain-containing protein [Nocardioides sp. SYSU D00038]